MGAALEAPVQKGLKDRTEASRDVPKPDTAKSQFKLRKNKKIKKSRKHAETQQPNFGLGAALRAPVQKGLEARTEASRDVPKPDAMTVERI